MKIATFNINNVNRRLANLLVWLGEAKPDVVCLQEIKTPDATFPSAALQSAGYEAVWNGQPTYNGVAILSKKGMPIVTRRALPGDSNDTQSRYIEAAVNGVLIASLYLPNGNPQPGPKFDYKLAWFDRLIVHARKLIAENVPVILAGDFNVVPTRFDIYPTKSYSDNALLQPESRLRFARLIKQGWIDTIRTRYPDQPIYTFWDYKRNRWEQDAGLRIDHLLLNENLKDRLVDAGVDKRVRAEEEASDHAPAWLVLKDPKKNSIRSRFVRSRNLPISSATRV